MTGYLDIKEAAAYLGIGVSTFKRLAPTIPAYDFAEPGAKKRLLRWLPADLDAWAAQRRTAA